MNQKAKLLTKYAFDDLTECECGKKLFKYHNTSTNSFYAKCSNYDIKPKKNKLPACGLAWCYPDMRPVFKEITKKINKLDFKFKETNFDKILEEKLRILFKFLYVSNNSSTLDEINILVKNSLKREPRKTFYFPSIGRFNRISHYEEFIDYEKRIFSEQIKDLNFIITKEKEKPVYFIDPNLLPKITIILPPKPPKKKIVKNISNFINLDDNETSEKYNSESENLEDSDKENSDYEDDIASIEETEEPEEILDDTEEPEETEEYCDYDED